MANPRAVSTLVIAVLVTVALASVAATVLGLVRSRDPDPQTARAPDRSAPAEPRAEVEAAAVLATWDADRAAAWAAGDMGRLRSLYAPGSVAGDRDVAMLQRWLDRGLVVDGLRTQVLSLREVRRSPDRWVLAVIDRLVDGVARGATTRRLPTDAPTSRMVTLRLVGDRWLVSSVG